MAKVSVTCLLLLDSCLPLFSPLGTSPTSVPRIWTKSSPSLFCELLQHICASMSLVIVPHQIPNSGPKRSILMQLNWRSLHNCLSGVCVYTICGKAECEESMWCGMWRPAVLPCEVQCTMTHHHVYCCYYSYSSLSLLSYLPRMLASTPQLYEHLQNKMVCAGLMSQGQRQQFQLTQYRSKKIVPMRVQSGCEI